MTSADGSSDALARYRRPRNLVVRSDGKPVNVARPRGQLFVCVSGCCCGRTADGFPPVPEVLYHTEWERRGLRNFVHLTLGGCLGPCALANVALLLFDGRALWFHSVNSDTLVLALYDYVESLLAADGYHPPAPVLARCQFTASAWEPRPDGQPVADRRRWRGRRDETVAPHRCVVDPPGPPTADGASARLVAALGGPAAVPRRNGELVFEAPWQGRAFGMAVALHEERLFPWDEFRDRLIAEIAAAGRGAEPSEYYEQWLAAFEGLLTERGIVSREEVEERTAEFEFGERDEVY